MYNPLKLDPENEGSKISIFRVNVCRSGFCWLVYSRERCTGCVTLGTEIVVPPRSLNPVSAYAFHTSTPVSLCLDRNFKVKEFKQSKEFGFESKKKILETSDTLIDIHQFKISRKFWVGSEEKEVLRKGLEVLSDPWTRDERDNFELGVI